MCGGQDRYKSYKSGQTSKNTREKNSSDDEYARVIFFFVFALATESLVFYGLASITLSGL